MKAYFKNVLDTGDLSLDKVLFEFEKLPIIFVCRDREECYYFCLYTDMIIDNTWMVTKVSRGLLLKLLDDEISILDMFKMSGNEIIIISQHGESMSCEKKKFQDISEDDLPEENEKLENPCLADYRKRLQDEMNKKKSIICGYEGKVSDSVQDILILGFEAREQIHARCIRKIRFGKPIRNNIFYLDTIRNEEDKYRERNMKFQEKSFFVESMESAGV